MSRLPFVQSPAPAMDKLPKNGLTPLKTRRTRGMPRHVPLNSGRKAISPSLKKSDRRQSRSCAREGLNQTAERLRHNSCSVTAGSLEMASPHCSSAPQSCHSRRGLGGNASCPAHHFTAALTRILLIHDVIAPSAIQQSVYRECGWLPWLACR